jgi:hypothetical protein
VTNSEDTAISLLSGIPEDLSLFMPITREIGFKKERKWLREK